MVIAHKLAGLLLRMEQELGLTPSARSGIEVPGPALTPEDQRREEADRSFGGPPLSGMRLPRRGTA